MVDMEAGFGGHPKRDSSLRSLRVFRLDVRCDSAREQMEFSMLAGGSSNCLKSSLL